MIDRHHPAVVAAMKSTAVDTLHLLRPDAMGWRKRVAHLLSAMLTVALPHLTPDDLHDTPAGQKLLAEGWHVGHTHATHGITLDKNPYRKDEE